MKKYRPLPFREGNKIVRKYTEDFVDKVGNKAKLTKLDYLNKGRLIKGFILTVEWKK